MKSIFSVRSEHFIEGNTHQQLLLFSHRKELDAENLAELLRNEYSKTPHPNEILIAVPVVAVGQLSDLIEFDLTLKRMIERCSEHSTISLVAFSFSGKETEKKHIAGPKLTFSLKLNYMSRQIITKLFKKHGGFVESTASYHFQNPSGRHSRQFVRLANILVESEEIGYMAFAALPYINSEAQYLYIDTPALHSVANSINEIRSMFDIPSLHVKNFHSYRGLENLEVEPDSNDTFMISASTSGGLARKLHENYEILDRNIVHFLFLGNSKISDNIICNLRKDQRSNPEGYERTTVFSKKTCEYCMRGSIVIPLYGDQFDIVSSQPDPVLITKSDAPKGLTNSLQTFLGSKSLTLYTIKDTGKKKRDFHIEFKNIFETQRFKDKLNYILRRNVPSNATIIVEADKGENMIGQEIYKFVIKNGGTATIVNEEKLKNIKTFNDRTVIVVAEVIESGRCLTNVSQALRENASDCPIIYIVGVEKTSENLRRSSLKSTITQSHNPVAHEFIEIERLILPVSTGKNSWLDEKNFLIRNEETLAKYSIEQIKQRLTLLEESSKPLDDNLFLLSEAGEKLKIQKGFVFWPENVDRTKVSQADVFYTISSVLQNLRVRSKLKSFWHYQTVLHPKNFERFNDGIIRASILRAATFGELDFSQYKDESNEMTQILLGILRECSTSAGQDAPEFLLALATRKLQLRDEDTAKIVNAAIKNNGIIGALANCMKNSNLG